MNKNIALLLMILPLLFSSNMLAEGFNDNYLQFGLIEGDGNVNLKGSVDVGDDFLLMGAYSQIKGVSGDNYSIGAGKNFDVYPKDFGNIILKYTQFTTSLSAGNKNQSDVSIGFRAISNFDIELGAKYSRVGKQGHKTNKVALEASKYIRKNLSIGGMIISGSARVLSNASGSSALADKTDTKFGIFVKRTF